MLNQTIFCHTKDLRVRIRPLLKAIPNYLYYYYIQKAHYYMFDLFIKNQANK